MADENNAADGGIQDRIKDLRSATESGGDLLETAKASQTRNPDATPDDRPPRKIHPPGTEELEPPAGEEPAGELEAGAEGDEPTGEEPQAEVDEAAAEKLDELAKRWGNRGSQEGDPEGTYRDDAGRLRDEVTHKFVSRGEGEEPQAGEAEPHDEGGEEPAGAEGDDVDGELEDGEELEDDDELVVEIPGRRDGETHEFKAKDAEEAERLRQLKNGYLRGQDYNRNMQAVRDREAELEQIVTGIEADPDSFILDHVNTDRRTSLARTLLLNLDEQEFDQLVDDIAVWDRDPSKYRLARAEAKEDRIEKRAEADRRRQSTRQQREAVNQIVGQVNQLVPEDMPPERASEFIDYALYKLEGYYGRKGANTDPRAVPEVLERMGVLKPFGLSTSQSESAPPASDDSARPGSPAGSSQAKEAKPVKTAEQVGEDLRKRRERRRNATASSPSGAGASPAGPVFQPGQTVKERIEAARRHYGA